MQSFVPGYLDASMEAFSQSQDDIRAKFQTPWNGAAGTSGPGGPGAPGGDAMEAFEGQARQNMAMFQQAIKMMSPFAAEGGAGASPDSDQAAQPQPTEATPSEAKPSGPKPSATKPTSQDETLDELRQQMELMQRRLDKIQGDA